MTRRTRIRPPLSVYISVLLLYLVMLALAPAMADEAPGRLPGDEFATRMSEALSLDIAQRAAVRDVMREFGRSMRQAMDKHGIEPSNGRRPTWHKMLAARAEMAEPRVQMENRMAEILTRRQMHHFRVLRKQQRAAWNAGRRKP